MAYTMQEQIELDQQLKRWQKRQLTAVRQNNVDKAFESMNDIERAVWEQVARAKSYKDISILAWETAYKVIPKFCKLAR
jgi:hypothetical protein